MIRLPPSHTRTGTLVTYTMLFRSLDTVRIYGKGRGERVLPLWRETQQALRRWISARGTVTEETLFLNRIGEPLSRDGLALMVAKHVRQASMVCPSLLSKRVTPHVLRHSCAAQDRKSTRLNSSH